MKINDEKELRRISEFAFEKQKTAESRCFFYRENFDEYYDLIKRVAPFSEFYLAEKEGKLSTVIILEKDDISMFHGIFTDDPDEAEQMINDVKRELETDKIDINISLENTVIEKMLLPLGFRQVSSEWNMKVLKEDFRRIFSSDLTALRITDNNIDSYAQYIEEAFKDCYWNLERLRGNLEEQNITVFLRHEDVAAVSRVEGGEDPWIMGVVSFSKDQSGTEAEVTQYHAEELLQESGYVSLFTEDIKTVPLLMKMGFTLVSSCRTLSTYME